MPELKVIRLPELAESEPECHWYAFKSFYNRVKPFKSALEAAGYQVFVPMKMAETRQDGVEMRKMVPAIASLFFVRCSEAFARQLKLGYNDALMYYPEPGTNKPAAIKDKEMEMFMFVCKIPDGKAEFFNEDCLQGYVGQKVRVIGGIYKGAEGYIKRIKKDRRLLVRIEGVAVVATGFIHPSLLEPVEE